MQTVYKEIGADISKMDGRKKHHSSKDTEDDIYENTRDCRPKPKQSTGPRTEDDDHVNTKCKTCPVLDNNKKTGKIVISALGLFLMFGALSALCAIVILYYNKAVSFEILSVQYENATATLKMHEHKAEETERLYELLKMKYQRVQDHLSACNETERLYGLLKVKYQQVQDHLSACNETERLYGLLKVKYQQVHDHLSACNANQNCKLCEERWKALGLKCYYFSTEKLNWTQSRDYCEEKGGHLVIITSQTEQDFVSSQIGETHWIGLNDLETEGNWIWVNKQPLAETGVEFWFDAPEGPHEPDNWKIEDPSGENCAALGDANGNIHKWFDASCCKLKQFICEK